MTYRAKNEFGGVNVETVIATIKNSNCAATIERGGHPVKTSKNDMRIG